MKRRLFLPLALLSLSLSACVMNDLISMLPEDLVAKVPGGADTLRQTGEVIQEVAAADMTPEQEYYLGRAVGAQILSRYPAGDDEKANIYLNRLGQGLSLYSAMPETFVGYHFFLLDSPEVNAFAAPGGFIFVTKGMIGLLSGEGELAAVLAHEIAHVQNRDAVGAIRNAKLSETLAKAGKDAAVRQAGGRVNPELLRAFSDSVGDIANTLMTRGYSRSQEYAADAAAVEILAQAGYDPRSLHAVLESMRRKVPAGSAGFGSTHPTAVQRLEALKGGMAASAPDTAARRARFQAALGAYSAR
ncbi:MAG: M48 family metalloprotease [Desulfovibrionaceae bacterium]|nr:M48 family metalloprotease [Desulfovibrionaceae bacterium]